MANDIIAELIKLIDELVKLTGYEINLPDDIDVEDLYIIIKNLLIIYYKKRNEQTERTLKLLDSLNPELSDEDNKNFIIDIEIFINNIDNIDESIYSDEKKNIEEILNRYTTTDQQPAI